MKKLFIAFVLLSTTAYMAANWHRGLLGPENTYGFNKFDGKSGMKKSPEKMARLIKYLKKQTIMQPPELLQRWNDFRADAIKTGAIELARQILPQLDCPIKRAKYKQLIKTMFSLAHQLRNLPIPEHPFKISLENLPLLLALKGRLMALKASQLMTIAEQTGAQPLLKKAKFKLILAKKIKHVLQLLDHGTGMSGKKAGMKASMGIGRETGMHDDYGFSYGNGANDDAGNFSEPIYIIVEED